MMARNRGTGIFINLYAGKLPAQSRLDARNKSPRQRAHPTRYIYSPNLNRTISSSFPPCQGMTRLSTPCFRRRNPRLLRPRHSGSPAFIPFIFSPSFCLFPSRLGNLSHFLCGLGHRKSKHGLAPSSSIAADWVTCGLDLSGSGARFRRGRGFGPAGRGTYEGTEMGDGASIVLAGLRIGEETLLVRDVFAYMWWEGCVS